MIWQAFSDGFSIFSEKWPLVLAAVVITGLGCSLIFSLPRGKIKEKTISWQSMGGVVFFFSISVILRLVFLSETFVPPYFDSVEHYRITRELVKALESSTLLETLPSLTPNYYHLGFHFLASLMSFGLRANPIDVILVLGQVILAAIPIPIFFLIQHETDNTVAAFFGTILAAFGWYMPGFAVNWGKYPALAGLMAFELVLSIAYFSSLEQSKRRRSLLSGLLILGIPLSTFFHTRTLIVIVISFVSWAITGKLTNLPNRFRYLSLGLLLAGILSLGIYIQRDPFLNLVLDPYLDDGIWITLTVVILSIFAFAKFPRGTYFNLLLIVSIFVALLIPIGNLLPRFENQTLLDRPFVEMLLYLPLSIFGGLGLAGLLQFFNETKPFSEKIQRPIRILAVIVFFSIVNLVLVKDYNFYASDCCKFVKYDDTIALDWLDANLPPDAHILIPATQMNVLPTGPSASSVGTDAGIWIPALTGRRTTFAQYETDFRSPDSLEMLCQKEIDYVYLGSTDQSFAVDQLLEKGDWYERILSLSNVQLFKVSGCN